MAYTTNDTISHFLSQLQQQPYAPVAQLMPCGGTHDGNNNNHTTPTTTPLASTDGIATPGVLFAVPQVVDIKIQGNCHNRLVLCTPCGMDGQNHTWRSVRSSPGWLSRFKVIVTIVPFLGKKRWHGWHTTNSTLQLPQHNLKASR